MNKGSHIISDHTKLVIFLTLVIFAVISFINNHFVHSQNVLTTQIKKGVYDY